MVIIFVYLCYLNATAKYPLGGQHAKSYWYRGQLRSFETVSFRCLAKDLRSAEQGKYRSPSPLCPAA